MKSLDAMMGKVLREARKKELQRDLETLRHLLDPKMNEKLEPDADGKYRLRIITGRNEL